MINVKLDNKAKATVSKTAGMSGTSYIAGNGITITEDNVINADTKVVEVPNITGLTNEQCEDLKAGDVVTEKVSIEIPYTVSRKDDYLMHLTHLETDYSVWCQVYTKVDGVWQYDQELSDENTMRLARDTPIVVLEESGGSIGIDDFENIVDRGYCYIVIDGCTLMAMISGINNPDEAPAPILATTVYQEKYYVATFEEVLPEDPEEEPTFNYTVTEETIGGNENVGIEYVQAGEFTPTVNVYNSFNQKYIQDRDFRASLLNGAYLVYNDIVLYPTMRTEDDSSITITYTSPEILGKKFIIDAIMETSNEGTFLYLSVEYLPNVITGYEANNLIIKNSHAGASADRLLSLLTQFGINTSNSFQNINIANLITIGLSDTENPIYYFKFSGETIHSVESTSLTNPSMADVVNEVFQGELHTIQDALAIFPLVVVIGDTNNGNHTSYPISTTEFSHLVYNWIDK